MINPLRRAIVAAALACALPLGAAQAQTATVATTQEGTTPFNFGLAIAKASSEVSGLDLRPKPFRSSGQGAVAVNRGEVDFGLHNAIVLGESYRGEAFYEGRALGNLRAVARLVPFQITLSTTEATGIETVEDMRGKRFPAGFDATAFGERLYDAMLRTAGLSYDDVEQVAVAGWREVNSAFVRGDIDVGGTVIGSANTLRTAGQVQGFRAISLTSGPEAEARMQAVFPHSRLAMVEPVDGMVGFEAPIVVMEYDYWLFAHAGTSDEAVTAVLDGLFEGQEILAGISADFRSFDPAAMRDDIGVPFHPAAEAFYASKGSQ